MMVLRTIVAQSLILAGLIAFSTIQIFIRQAFSASTESFVMILNQAKALGKTITSSSSGKLLRPPFWWVCVINSMM